MKKKQTEKVVLKGTTEVVEKPGEDFNKSMVLPSMSIDSGGDKQLQMGDYGTPAKRAAGDHFGIGQIEKVQNEMDD